VVPAARARLRSLVGHLVADADHLHTHLAATRAQGYALNVNLLGEAVLGHREARERLERTLALVRRPDVDYISIKVSSVAAQLVTWDLPGSRDRVVRTLLPLFRAARDHGVFLNLDMEEYRDLALTTAVFTDLMGREEFGHLSAGIVLQAYLPDTLAALDLLTETAVTRVAAGGSPIKIRLVKGANLAMETVEAELHGWPRAPYPTKPEVDAHYLRLLDRALNPSHANALRVGLASHNLFDVAFGLLLARARGVEAALDIEMLQGMAPAQARAVRDELTRVPGSGRMVLYTPAVRRADFDVAISYLVRRLEENAADGNFLHALTGFSGSGGEAMARQEIAFREAARRAVPFTAADVSPRRTGERTAPEPGAAFTNAPDTDPALAASRQWAGQITARGIDDPLPALTEPVQVDDAVAAALRAADIWSRVPVTDRAAALVAVADRLEAARGNLVAAMVHEPGKTIAEADPEVSEAVDFARYYAQRALDLEAVPGARFDGGGVTLVAPPWNFPVAIPVGGITAALAAGSGVVAKPASPTPRCLAVAVEAIRAGLSDAGCPVDPADLVRYARVPDRDLARRLVTHPDVGRVVLTGSIETARLFASWVPGRTLLAETSGKNAIVVTPSADIDLAVADVVRSAFGHAGQKCSAASLLILVGSAGDPRTVIGRRLYRQLSDAVRSMAVGAATDLGTVMGPLTEPARGKLEQALTRLGDGEAWLVRPRCLAGSGDGDPAGESSRAWTPGVKRGVQPGSSFHLTEVFGPVLGIMRAATLDEAIALQNAVPFGLTGGIHSLDEAEIDRWLETVEVGNAYVNRHITGAIVQRQPFGGWKMSAVGPGAKAGGPHYVAQFGRWSDSPDIPALDTDPAGWLAWARADDERWWAREFAADHDPSDLRVESNVLRYRPVELLTVRVGAGAREAEVDRIRHAAQIAGVPMIVVGPQTSDADFAEQVRSGAVSGRVRVVGYSAGLTRAGGDRVGEVTILDQPVVASGRRELLTVLREQAISRTRHRYGHVHE
jgi:RHH-type proline utilization regulon transcriptional repressor/proline dehydrogenase/delta 1-pyrroline-5-carboxylate dehydrogenase